MIGYMMDTEESKNYTNDYIDGYAQALIDITYELKYQGVIRNFDLDAMLLKLNKKAR